MAEEKFDFSKFINDTLKILVKPGEYFSGMAKSGGFGDPLIRAVIYGLLAGIINMLLSIMKLGHMRGMFGGMLGGGIGIAALITTLFVTFVGLFISGVVVLIISAICSGNNSYEASVRVSASLMVLMPIKSLLGLLSGFSFHLGLGVSLLTSLYGIYLLYYGITEALEGKKQVAKVISAFLTFIPILMIIGSFMCMRAVKDISTDAQKFMKEFPKENREFQKNVEKLQKMMEDLQKKKIKEQ